MPYQEGPFGGYVDVADVVSAAAQVTILAEIDKFKALVERVNGQSMPSPEFVRLDPALADILVVELDALKTAIDAAPTV